MAQDELDKAAALADKSHLHQFDGRDVLATTIAITNAGDGLSKAMKVDPREFHHDEKVYVVLECDVAKVSFSPLAEGTQELVRVHTLRAGAATIVDGDLVKAHLDQQAARIQEAKDKAAGVVNLEGEPGWLSDETGTKPDGAKPEDDDEDDEAQVLRRNHMAGNHTEGQMVGCPICDEQAVDDAVKDDGTD